MDRTSWIAVGSLVAGAVAAATLADKLGNIDLKAAADVGRVTGQFMMLIFIALLIERAVEVFIGPLTGQEKDALVAQQGQLRKRMEEANAALTQKRDELIKAPDVPAIKDAIATLEAAIKADREAEAQVIREIGIADRRTQKIALAISIPLSFAAALAGVRAIGSLLPEAFLLDGQYVEAAANVSNRAIRTVANLTADQRKVFSAIDVVLTAGLLAGGADGVHKILDRFLKMAAGKDVPQPAAKS